MGIVSGELTWKAVHCKAVKNVFGGALLEEYIRRSLERFRKRNKRRKQERLHSTIKRADTDQG